MDKTNCSNKLACITFPDMARRGDIDVKYGYIAVETTLKIKYNHSLKGPRSIVRTACEDFEFSVLGQDWYRGLRVASGTVAHL